MKPLKFYNEEGQIPTASLSGHFQHNDTPNVHVDSNGKLFHDAPGVTRRELKLHPFCCFVKSKQSAGYSSVALKDRLKERSFAKTLRKLEKFKMRVIQSTLISLAPILH